MPQTYIDFAFVKEHASFEAVLAHYNLEKVRSGQEWSILCPFHREKRPSCKVNPAKKAFHCFGCEERGNLLEFVAKMEGEAADLRSAALKLAEICHIPLAAPRRVDNGGAAGESRPRRHGDDTVDARKSVSGGEKRTPAARRAQNGARRDAESARAAEKPARAAAEHSHESDPAKGINAPLSFELKLDPEHPYLVERGLSEETIAEFGLGYCSRGSMNGRICIPIHNERGELVAYAGRWPGEDDIPEGEDKYKLPARFEKTRLLYNLNRAPEGEHVVLVEGYWSAIRLHTLRIPVVALMGWSISGLQVALLQERGVRFVTLLLDGDETGRRGRERVIPELASVFYVRAPLLPDGEKPDTLAEGALRQLVGWK